MSYRDIPTSSRQFVVVVVIECINYAELNI
jgi:hypothetical protein